MSKCLTTRNRDINLRTDLRLITTTNTSTNKYLQFCLDKILVADLLVKKKTKTPILYDTRLDLVNSQSSTHQFI